MKKLNISTKYLKSMFQFVVSEVFSIKVCKWINYLVCLLIGGLLFSMAACDSTYEYKELKIVTLDKVQKTENSEIDNQTYSRFDFFNYHKGDSICFIPQNIYLIRIDEPNSGSKEFLADVPWWQTFSKKTTLSNKREEVFWAELLNAKVFFQESKLNYEGKLNTLNEFINVNSKSSRIYLFDDNSAEDEITIGNVRFPIYKDSIQIFKEIESLLLQKKKNKIEYLDQLSIIIVFMPFKEVNQDSIRITNISRNENIIRKCYSTNLNFRHKIGLFETDVPSDSILWEVTEKSLGFSVVPDKGTGPESIVRIKTTSNNLTGYIKILVTPYKTGKASKPEEFVYNYTVIEIIKTDSIIPCQKIGEIKVINKERYSIIDDFKELAHQIWTSTDPVLLDSYKQKAKEIINLIPDVKVEYYKSGDKLELFLNDLIFRNFSKEPNIEPKFDSECNIIEGIIISR